MMRPPYDRDTIDLVSALTRAGLPTGMTVTRDDAVGITVTLEDRTRSQLLALHDPQISHTLTRPLNVTTVHMLARLVDAHQVAKARERDLDRGIIRGPLSGADITRLIRRGHLR